MFDRILVPVDGSDPATAALEHALDLAADADATVHVLYVADTNEPSLTRVGGAVVDVLEEEGEEIVADATSRAADRGVSVVDDVVQGDPREAIVEYASARGVDLIAMGAHGRRGLGEYVLGSTTDRVVGNSQVPVLTVRSADDATRSYPYEDVLVPTDGSDHAAAALDLGSRIADERGATLHLLTVVDDGGIGLDGAGTVTERLEERARETLADASGATDAADVVTSVAFGSAAAEIETYAGEAGVDVVVLGTHGRTGLDRHLLGSTSERVVRTSPVPVLTTRDGNE